MKINLSKEAYTSIQALKAADNETLTGSGVDRLGFDSVRFVVGSLKGEELDFGIKVQQDSDPAFGTAADLLGTADTFSTDVYTDGLAIMEVHNPSERYLRPVITVPNASAATPVFCIVDLYNADRLPITQNTGAEVEVHHAPAEGTA